MSDLATLSAKKFREVFAQRDARYREMCDAIERAGLCGASFAQLVELAKGSSLLARTRTVQDFLNAHRDWVKVTQEGCARRDYHGIDRYGRSIYKPIPRP